MNSHWIFLFSRVGTTWAPKGWTGVASRADATCCGQNRWRQWRWLPLSFAPQSLSQGFTKWIESLICSPLPPPPSLLLLTWWLRVHRNSPAIGRQHRSLAACCSRPFFTCWRPSWLFSSREGRNTLMHHVLLGTLSLLIFFFDFSKPNGFPLPVTWRWE